MNMSGLREAIRDWKDAGDATTRTAILARVTELAAGSETSRAPGPVEVWLGSADPDAPDLLDSLRAALAPTTATAEPCLTTPPRPRPAEVWGGPSGSVLSHGEAATLYGPGGGGKSRVALQLAIRVAAGKPGARVAAFPPALEGCADVPCLLAGRSAVLSYEDDAPRVQRTADRMARYLDDTDGRRRRGRLAGELGNGSKADAPHGRAIRDAGRLALFCPGYSDALYGVQPGALAGTPPGPLAFWRPFWRAMERLQPTLIVIDPAMIALAVDGHSALPVGAFLGAIRDELRSLDCCAALIVHHVSKATRAGIGDAGALGSVAWTDRPRACIEVATDPTEGAEAGALWLDIPKANYARRGCLARVEPISDGGGAPLAYRLAGVAPLDAQGRARPLWDVRKWHGAAIATVDEAAPAALVSPFKRGEIA